MTLSGGVMSNKLTITDLNGSVTEIELENLDEKIESIVAYRLRQRTRELNAAERRVQELEVQLAAQAWRPVTDEEPETSQIVEILVYGYRNDDDLWLYPDGSTPIRGWRPID